MKPTYDRQKLMHYINDVSFAVNEATLFLDTHPCDKEAMEYFQQMNEIRNQALKEYSQYFSPLTISTAQADGKWDWGETPLPWEGGSC